LNHFLRSVRALTVNREFVDQGPNYFWCLAIEYLADVTGKSGDKSNRNRIDYKEVLSPEDFAVFVKLREWRKQAATSEAVPVYTIFSNEQLADIAQRRIATKIELHKISGVGEARVKKYAEAVFKIIEEAKASREETAS